MTKGYTIEIKRGEETLKTATTEAVSSEEVRAVLDTFLADGGLTLDNVPDDITVKASFGENTLEEKFKEVYAGFQLVASDVAALEIRKHLSRIASVSDLQAAAVTVLFKSDGLKGFTVLFGEDFDSEAASIFANGTKGHADQMAKGLAEQFKLESQDENLIILPGRG